jgi:hypothetical protein
MQSLLIIFVVMIMLPLRRSLRYKSYIYSPGGAVGECEVSMESDTNCSSLLSSAISSDGLSCFADVDFAASAVKEALQHHASGTTANRNSTGTVVQVPINHNYLERSNRQTA